MPVAGDSQFAFPNAAGWFLGVLVSFWSRRPWHRPREPTHRKHRHRELARHTGSMHFCTSVSFCNLQRQLLLPSTPHRADVSDSLFDMRPYLVSPLFATEHRFQCGFLLVLALSWNKLQLIVHGE